VSSIGLHGLRFHDLRHVHATLLITSGAPIVVVQHRLGHSRPSITLDRYSHLFDGVDAAAAERLDEDGARIRIWRRRVGRGPITRNPCTTRPLTRGR